MPSRPTRPKRTIGISLKLYFTPTQTITYYHSLAPLITLAASKNIHFFLIPSIVSLPLLLQLNDPSNPTFQLATSPSKQDIRTEHKVSLGAQDCSAFSSGAYTGEISPLELSLLGCSLVELGHAERRRLFGETDEKVASKAKSVLENGMVPLICIGEKNHGSIEDAVVECRPQVTSILDFLDIVEREKGVAEDEKMEVIFAYEPVWAIGQAAPASAEYVVDVVKKLRGICEERGRNEIRFLYGGSAGPGTFEGMKESVDGLFLGRFAHDIESVRGVIEEVGASFVGISIAHNLLKHTLSGVKDLKVVLVGPNTHIYWNLASVRAVVPGALSDDKMFAEIAPGFKQYPSASYELIQGTATGVDSTAKTVSIQTPSGVKEQTYTQLVIATGSRTASENIPWKQSIEGTEKTKQLLHEYQEKVQAAKNIVVVGAGPTGVETAAELAFEYKGSKEITLITGGATILPGLPASVIKVAENQLKSMKIKIVVNTKVTDSAVKDGKTELTLSTGSNMTTDLYLPTIGIIPNTEFLPASIKDTKGDVNVNEFLQVKAVDGVWAAGDVVSIQPKQMAFAAEQAKALAKNLGLVLKNQKPVAYKSDTAPMIAVTLGKSKGTGRMGNMKLPSIMVWFVKGRTLFTEKLPKYASGSEF
ncbi:hypothetical protein HYALB_00005483 [Hymenoscyphus albidus]|uniref:triose-phosphate isomerase n=1 Tax=Hymenoscyphus albidus TaxID=595503 RepID=A0A9N9M391_9HELO|nr:hypothetical protein HYALB_00005483 [Hymenoscyphus albidus]